MPTDNVAKAVGQDFYESLLDLKQNSKPHINMLTMLADENLRYADVIVEMITKHIKETNHKLSAMYLMDSILKNVGKDYKRLFASHIVSIFSTVFKHVEEGTRKKLYDLRHTWNAIFPPSRLYMLDITIQEIDPAWPLTATTKMNAPPQTIHINPKFKQSSRMSTDKQEVKDMPNLSEFPSAFPEQPAQHTHNKAGLQELLKVQKVKKEEKQRATRKLEHIGDQISSQVKAGGTIHIAPWKAKQFTKLPAVTVKNDDLKKNSTKPSEDAPSKTRDPRLKENKPDVQKSEIKANSVMNHTGRSSSREKSKETVKKNNYTPVNKSLDINKHKRKYSINEYNRKYKKSKSDSVEKAVSSNEEMAAIPDSNKESSKLENLTEIKPAKANPKCDPQSNKDETTKMIQSAMTELADKDATVLKPNDNAHLLIQETNSTVEACRRQSSPPPPPPKRSCDEAENGNNNITAKKAHIEVETVAKPSADVDLRKLSIPPIPSDALKERSSLSDFSLFGTEDVDYRRLQFPPLPMPPIFPCAALPLPLPGIVSNFLPGIVSSLAPSSVPSLTPASVPGLTPASVASLAPVSVPSLAPVSVPSLASVFMTAIIPPVTCPSLPTSTTIAPVAYSPERIPPATDTSTGGLMFNELAPPGLTIAEVSPDAIGSGGSISPAINGVGSPAAVERSIDMTTGGGDDIVCIDDVQAVVGGVNPYEADNRDDYYSIVSDIHDQLQWDNISRDQYNLLMVRLQETDRNGQLELFRMRYMPTTKNASGDIIVTAVKPPRRTKPTPPPPATFEKLQPPQILFGNFATPLGGPTLPPPPHSSTNGNSSVVARMPKPPAPPTSLLYPAAVTNNVRPAVPQACTDAYGATTYQYNPPANMVPRTTQPDTSIDVLQSILASIGQAPPVRPRAPPASARAPHRDRYNRRDRHGRHYRRAESVSSAPTDGLWIPKKEDLWKSATLKTKNEFVTKATYYGTQCSSCGLRFLPEEKEKYSRHLDWHFRMNKKQQESTRKANSREWYVVVQNWKLYEEMDSEEPVGSSLFDDVSGSDGSDGTVSEADIPSVAVSTDDTHTQLAICPECTEKFSNYFHHDLDEWHYKNAVQHSGINYHPSCYEGVLKRRERMERNGENSRSPEVAAEQSVYEVEPSSPVAPTETTIRVEEPLRSIYRMLDDEGTPATMERLSSVYIKEETVSIEDGIDMFIPPPQPRLLADLPLKMEIKEEPMEIEETIEHLDTIYEVEDEESEPAVAVTAETESVLADIIDGNDASVPITDITARPSPLIRISMGKSHNASAKVTDVVPPSNVIRDVLKPAFDDLQLTDQPPRNAGMDMTSLCSIM